MSTAPKLNSTYIESSSLRPKSMSQSRFSANKESKPQIQTKLMHILRPKVIQMTSNNNTPQLISSHGFPKNISSVSLKTKSGFESPAFSFKGGQTPIQSVVLDHQDNDNLDNSSRPITRPESKAKKVSIVNSFDSAFNFGSTKTRNIMSSTISTNFTSKVSRKESKDYRDDLTSATQSLRNTTSQQFFRFRESSSQNLREGQTPLPGVGIENEFQQSASTIKQIRRKSLNLSRVSTAPQGVRQKISLEQKPSLSTIQNINLEPDQKLAVEEYFEELIGFHYKKRKHFNLNLFLIYIISFMPF